MIKRLGCLVCAARLLAAAQGANALGDLSEALQNLSRKVSPAVVKVQVTAYGPTSDDGRGKAAVVRRQHVIGSGAIVDPSGYIVTNAHVIEGAQQVTVVLREGGGGQGATAPHGRTMKATIVGRDQRRDIAVLKVDATGLPALSFGDYAKVRQGQVVLAFGSPEGLEDSVTMGVVSSAARQPDPEVPMMYVQTDAAVNPGNSGGPLVDVSGNLIGINTFILSESGGSQGLNFAIPSFMVGYVYHEILTHGHVHQRALGIRPQEVTAALAAGLGLTEERGLIVSDVLPDGPAAKAGLEIRDVLLQLDGTPVNSLPDYEMALYLAPHGDAVTLGILRGAQRLSLKVPVVEQQLSEIDDVASLVDPQKSLVQELGILGLDVSGKVADLIGDLRVGSGVVVAALAAESGVDSGLQPGDVIHSLNGAPIRTLAELRTGLAALKPGDPVALHLERDGRLMYLAFELE